MNLRRKKSTQELIGIKGFSRYGLKMTKNELVYFLVSPVNISVLSHTSVEIKIHHLMMVLSTVPDIEIVCLDSCECFDDNKNYITERLKEEANPCVCDILKKDLYFLDSIQLEMSTARQFMFVARIKNSERHDGEKGDTTVLNNINRIEKAIADRGFEVKRIGKDDIKRILAIYFESSMSGDRIGDVDGANYLTEDSIERSADIEA